MANVISKPRPRLRSGVDENGSRFFYDITTRNLSFLQTAKDLQMLGIKNNQFFLKLYDRELIGADPFSPSLSRELMDRINMECVLNPWYFQRECVRIPSQGGATGPGSGDMFALHRGNLAACWCFDNSIDFYLVIPRQCYKTHTILSKLDWGFLFGTANSQFNFSNQTQGDSDANLDKMKNQRDCLPIFMQQKFAVIKDVYGDDKVVKGKDNVRTWENPINNNVIVSKPSATTIAKADSIGRGNSAPIQYYDEAEFTQFIGTILSASGPAYKQAADNSARNGAIHCRIISSTPGFLDTQPVKDMNQWRDNMALFTERMYDMNPEEVHNYIKKSSRNQMVYIEFNYKQIGKDEKWFQDMCAFVNYDPIKIKRELLLYRVNGNTNSPFDPDDLEVINTYRTNPIEEHMIHNGDFLLRIYSPIEKETPYILGVDVCTGVNEDSTAIVILDPYLDAPIGIVKTPLMDEPDLAEVIAELLSRFFPKAMVAIERNHTGSGVINLLKRTKYRSRLYNDPTKMDNTPDDKLDQKGRLIKKAENSKFWGVATSKTSKKVMMEHLQLRVRDYRDKFVCAEIIDDLNNLVRKGESIEAAVGEHDDAIMAYNIAMYVLKNGYKLSRYGIHLGIRKEEYEAMQGARENDPVAMWEALPDKYKALFPKPGASTIVQSVSADAGPMRSEDIQELHKTKDPLYDQIIAAQNSRKNKHRYTISAEGMKEIEGDPVEDLIKQAEEEQRYGAASGDISDDWFDIADILNK